MVVDVVALVDLAVVMLVDVAANPKFKTVKLCAGCSAPPSGRAPGRTPTPARPRRDRSSAREGPAPAAAAPAAGPSSASPVPARCWRSGARASATRWPAPARAASAAGDGHDRQPSGCKERKVRLTQSGYTTELPTLFSGGQCTYVTSLGRKHVGFCV